MVGLYVEIQMNTYLYAYIYIYTVYTCIIFLYVASLRHVRSGFMEVSFFTL